MALGQKGLPRFRNFGALLQAASDYRAERARNGLASGLHEFGYWVSVILANLGLVRTDFGTMTTTSGYPVHRGGKWQGQRVETVCSPYQALVWLGNVFGVATDGLAIQINQQLDGTPEEHCGDYARKYFLRLLEVIHYAP